MSRRALDRRADRPADATVDAAAPPAAATPAAPTPAPVPEPIEQPLHQRLGRWLPHLLSLVLFAVAIWVIHRRAGPVPYQGSARAPARDPAQRGRGRHPRGRPRLRHPHALRPAGAALPRRTPALPADGARLVHGLRLQPQSGPRLAQRRRGALPPVHGLGPVVARHRRHPRLQHGDELPRPRRHPGARLPRRAGPDRGDPASARGGGDRDRRAAGRRGRGLRSSRPRSGGSRSRFAAGRRACRGPPSPSPRSRCR